MVLGSPSKFTINHLFVGKVTKSLWGTKLECRAQSGPMPDPIIREVPLDIYREYMNLFLFFKSLPRKATVKGVEQVRLKNPWNSLHFRRGSVALVAKFKVLSLLRPTNPTFKLAKFFFVENVELSLLFHALILSAENNRDNVFYFSQTGRSENNIERGSNPRWSSRYRKMRNLGKFTSGSDYLEVRGTCYSRSQCIHYTEK